VPRQNKTHHPLSERRHLAGFYLPPGWRRSGLAQSTRLACRPWTTGFRGPIRAPHPEWR